MTEIVLDDFSEKSLPHRDLGLNVGKKTFWVSRESLAESSSVFKAMLYGKFEEAGKDVIELPGKDAQEILEILRCLFTIKEIDCNNVDLLLKFSDEYDMKCFQKHCKNFLVVQLKSTKESKIGEGEKRIIDLFLTGIRYQFQEVVRGALPAVARFGLSKLQPHFDRMPIELQKSIFLQMAGHSLDHKYEYRENGHCTSCHHIGYGIVNVCKYCQFGICSKCLKNGLEKRSAFAVRCCICRTCRKPTVVDTCLRDEMQLNACQCVNALAVAELEKIGL